MKIRLVTALMACAALKLAAMAEWPPLYRAFLFVPANLLAIFVGSEYTEAAGIYTFPDFILDYSCSGIHFFIIALLLATLISRNGWGEVIQGAALAYIATLAANTFRVGLSLKLMPLSAGRPWLHEAIGTVVFMSCLIACYFILQRIQTTTRPLA